jgi:hypothetical protein
MAALLAACAPAGAFSPTGHFSSDTVPEGVEMSQEECKTLPDARWTRAMQPDGSYAHACIRTYVAGLVRGGSVLFWLHEDLLLGAVDGQGQPAKEPLAVRPDWYHQLTPAVLQQRVETLASRLGIGVVFIGRPGTHGSSGRHTERRRLAEILQVELAIRETQEDWRFTRTAIAGQSGGGYLAAAMARRIEAAQCFVAASAPLALTLRNQILGMRVPGLDWTGHRDSYDLILDALEMKPNAGRRILVIGDPRDRQVAFAAQQAWVTVATGRGIDATLIEVRAHTLVATAQMAAALCLAGQEDAAIARQAAAGETALRGWRPTP